MDIKEMKFSVLMSVYYKEKPEYFLEAVESVINQTIKPTEIVIVKDGALTEELEDVCSILLHKYSPYIRFIPLEKNVGLGLALQKGVLECRYDLIARMDTDDISNPERFEKQLKAFVNNSQLSVCGGFIEEFSNSPQEIDGVRRVPKENASIYQFAKKRNPFNHMTVMFKKRDVLDVGNYQPFFLLEDYYLWVRMILANKEMINLSEPLVSVRGGTDMIVRRGGWTYFLKEKTLFDKFFEVGFISRLEYIYILAIRFFSRILPDNVRKNIYNLFLRNKIK